MKRVLLIVHPTRPAAAKFANDLSSRFVAQGYEILSNYPALIDSARAIDEVHNSDWAIVLGGDGTILRGAEIALDLNIPLLGINLGHVGFMAEVDSFTFDDVAEAIIKKDYVLDQRMLLSFAVKRDNAVIENGWSLNEVSIERKSTTMLELFVQIDQRPLSRWGCDGIICATPTGSTAYAFSAGGPVLWPEIDALVLLPISAHALFSRPMVVSPTSEIIVDIESREALLSSDSLRKFKIQQGDRVLITRDSTVIKLSHIKPTLFTDRLVAKFKLPVEGWRGE